MGKKFNYVLLVDDDETSNFITHTVVSRMDMAHGVQTNVNSQDALDFTIRHLGRNAEKECPDMIMLDINMPDMDGFQFLDELDKHGLLGKDELRIVMLTSSESERDVNKSMHYAIHAYLNKPLTPEKLQTLMRQLGC